MKTKFMKLLVMVVAVVCLVAFAACKTDDKPSGGAAQSPLKTTDDVYAFSAFTGTTLLGEFGASEPEARSMAFIPMANADSETIADEKLEEINKYLNMFEGMLTGSDPIETVIEKDVEFEGVAYAEKMTIKIKNIDGTVTERVMYYNETAKGGVEAKTMSSDDIDEADDNDSDESDDNDEKDEFEEIETTLEGIMVEGGEIFTVTGEKELEEGEMEVKFTTTDSAGNKVIIEQEVEEGEQEYLYEVYDASGKKLSSSEMEFEVEDDEIEIELTIKEGQNREVYKFEKEIEDNKTIIKLHYTIDGKMHTAKIKILTDEETGEQYYEYNFSNGHKTDKPRGEKDKNTAV